MNHTKLRLHGFSQAEILSLEDKIGKENLTVEQARARGARHGTLNLYDVIVVLAPQVTGLLALWLTLHRSKTRKEESADIVHKDGSAETRHVVYTTEESKADPDVVAQIEAITNPAPRAGHSAKKGDTPAKSVSRAAKPKR
jgi:hypothetical protein